MMRRLAICCLIPLVMPILESRVAFGAGDGRIPAGSSPPPGQRLDVREGTLGASGRNRVGERVRSVVEDRRRAASLFSTLDVDTLQSPGMEMGITVWDEQSLHSQGYQVGRNSGEDVVHFCWSYFAEVGEWNWGLYVHYNSYSVSTGTWNQGFGGESITLGDFAGGLYGNLAVGHDNTAHVALHQKSSVSATSPTPYHFYFPNPGIELNNSTEMMLTPEVGDMRWPRVEVQQNDPARGQSGTDVVHLVSHSPADEARELLAYWRYDGVSWAGPVLVDSTATLGYVLAADPNSEAAAIFLHSEHAWDGFEGMRNIAYYSTASEGAGWIDGSELGPENKIFITGYDDPAGPEAWVHISCAYDNAGVLHAVWDEQRFAGRTAQVAIRHWNGQRQTIRPVALGYWDNPKPTGGYDLNLAKITIGIGDGSTVCTAGPGDQTNRDYLYVLYTQFGGPSPEEQADYSESGFMTGELVLSVSNDQGLSWSIPENLTNTRTPGCSADSPYLDICASEHWATIAKTVDDISIFYILDFLSGPSEFREWWWSPDWTVNRAMYLRIPGGGTDDTLVCPLIRPNLAAWITEDPDCDYHASPGGMAEATFTVMNLGNALLTGDVSVPSGTPWLSVVGGGPYALAVGAPDLELSIQMDASGLAEGFYTGTVRVTHDDATKPSPLDFPIAFYATGDFHCPETVVLRTGVASPGVLALQVDSDGRFGSQNPQAGMWRPFDSSYSIFDATLLIAHGSQDPDTVVFHDFYGRMDPGNRGFRVLSEYEVDTSSYASGSGYASTRTVMTTADSVIGIDVRWFFPQDPAYADFVIAQYTVWNRTSSPVDSVVVGLWADLNVMAANHTSGVQADNGNVGESDAGQDGRNLIYLYGYDTVGHVPSDYFHSSQRYSGGVSYMHGRDANGDAFSFVPASLLGGTRDNRENTRDGGPTSHRLYRTITGAYRVPPFTPGFEEWLPFPGQPDSVADGYLFLMLDRGRTLAADGANPETYVVAWVSDTLWHPAYGPPPGKSVLSGGLSEAVDSAWSWAERYVVCGCQCHGDPECDGVIDVLDVVHAVGEAFREAPSIADMQCPHMSRSDVNCDCVVNVFDVVYIVDRAFRNGTDPFCNPCAQRCP